MRANSRVILGFDYGTRRIGVAVGNTVSRDAGALATLACHQDGPDWPAIARMINEWRPAALVVGLPLTVAGEDQPTTTRARRFMRELHQRFGLSVHACDERYSSLDAQSVLRAARAGTRCGRRPRKGDTDATAARVILDAWLANVPHHERTGT